MLVLHRKAHFAVSKLLTDHDHTHKAIKLVESVKVMCYLMTDLQIAALMNNVKSKNIYLQLGRNKFNPFVIIINCRHH